MRFRSILITLILIIPITGCGTIKAGKTIAVDNPIDTSRNKKSLSDAREDVQNSRRELDKCLSANSGDETRCAAQKEQYDADVEIYADLQTK